jgi:chaperone modulatory protein CbpM
MQAQATLHWLDAQETIGADELCHACRITVEELYEIVEYGVLAPVHAEAQLFTADWLMPLREAARLRRDYDMDWFAAGLIAEHLHHISRLEQEIRSLRGRLGA